MREAEPRDVREGAAGGRGVTKVTSALCAAYSTDQRKWPKLMITEIAHTARFTPPEHMAMKLSSRGLFWLTSALSLMAMAVALLLPNPAIAADRVVLSTPDIQGALIGRGMRSSVDRGAWGRKDERVGDI